MDPTDDLMLAPDPLQELLASISSAPAAARTGATASTFPSHRPAPRPMAAPPVGPPPMPTPAPLTTNGGGPDWRAILRLVAPAVGSLVAGGGHQMPAFWSGYQGGLAELDAARQQQQIALDNRRKAAAEFLLQTEHQAEGYDDPAQLAQYLSTADEAGSLAGLTAPGSLKNKYTVSPNKIADHKLAELNKLQDDAEKGGYNLDDLASAGAVFTLKDGSHVPVATSIDLTRKRPLDAQGKPVAKPIRPAGTEEERFLQQRAKDYGYGSLDAVDADTQLNWRRDFRESGRAETKPGDEAGPGGQLRDLVAVYKLGHNGQDPPPSVMLQLRKQANQVNDKPAADVASRLDPLGLDYAATQYRVTGLMPALGQRSNEDRAAVINTAAKQTRDLGQSPAIAIQRQAARKSDGAALTQMTKMASSAEAFETKANSQAEIIRDLSAKVDRTQIPLINSAIQAGRVELLGDKNAQLLANAITTFTAEYAKIIEGSTGSAAGSSDAARKATERLVSAKLNKGTLDATLTLMQREMALTRSGYDATIEHITTRMGGPPPPPPPPTTPTTAPASPVSYADYLKAKGGK